MALTDLLKYTLEVLNLFGYNTSLLAIYIGTIKNCGNYVQVKVEISEFSPLLLLSLVGKQNHLLFPVSHAPFFQGGNYTIFWAKSWQFCGTPQIKPSLSTFLKKRTNRAKRTVSHLQKMQFRVEQSPSQKFHLIFIDHVKNDKKSTKLDAISND